MRFWWLLVLLVGLVLAGCGGSGSGSGSGEGSLSLTVEWPEDSRLIPVMSESVVVTVSRDGKVLRRVVLAKPVGGGAATASIESLPVTEVKVEAQAYPEVDGTGVAQASASVFRTMVRNETVQVELTMASTIASIEVFPSGLSVSLGGTTDLFVSALDSEGQVVLVDSNRWSFSVSPSTIATVGFFGPSATLTGVALGAATLTVTETESGFSKSFPVTVIDAPGDVVVSPSQSFVEGQMVHPQIKLFDGNGEQINIPLDGVSFQSDNQAVLEGEGTFLRAKSAGVANVTAIVGGTASVPVAVTVTPRVQSSSSMKVVNLSGETVDVVGYYVSSIPSLGVAYSPYRIAEGLADKSETAWMNLFARVEVYRAGTDEKVGEVVNTGNTPGSYVVFPAENGVGEGDSNRLNMSQVGGALHYPTEQGTANLNVFNFYRPTEWSIGLWHPSMTGDDFFDFNSYGSADTGFLKVPFPHGSGPLWSPRVMLTENGVGTEWSEDTDPAIAADTCEYWVLYRRGGQFQRYRLKLTLP